MMLLLSFVCIRVALQIAYQLQLAEGEGGWSEDVRPSSSQTGRSLTSLTSLTHHTHSLTSLTHLTHSPHSLTSLTHLTHLTRLTHSLTHSPHSLTLLSQSVTSLCSILMYVSGFVLLLLLRSTFMYGSGQISDVRGRTECSL